MWNHLNDVFTDIKDTNDDDKTIKQYVVQDGNLENIMMDMVHGKPGYIPDVVYECGKVSHLRFKISNIIGSISTCSTLDSSEKQKAIIIVPAIYEQYHKARNELYKDLLKLDYMSTYNPENM